MIYYNVCSATTTGNIDITVSDVPGLETIFIQAEHATEKAKIAFVFNIKTVDVFSVLWKLVLNHLHFLLNRLKWSTVFSSCQLNCHVHVIMKDREKLEWEMTSKATIVTHLRILLILLYFVKEFINYHEINVNIWTWI